MPPLPRVKCFGQVPRVKQGDAFVPPFQKPSRESLIHVRTKRSSARKTSNLHITVFQSPTLPVNECICIGWVNGDVKTALRLTIINDLLNTSLKQLDLDNAC